MAGRLAPPEAAAKPLLLLVDDDRDLVTALRLHLRREGYEVETAPTVRDGLRAARARLPHLAVVDLMLPDGSGLDVARELRQNADVPVIVLSAVNDEDVIIQRLHEIADDYVTKPFSARELTARIASVLRRAWPAGHPTADVVRLRDGVEIDLMHRRVQTPDATAHLTPTESRLLWLLLSNAGQVLPSATLLARVWADGGGTPAGLWEYIRRLREKLGDNPAQPRYIITERDAGYRFPKELLAEG